MKTAISLPDGLFRAAEQYAKQADKARSQLYAEAMSEYLARHAPDDVTKAMNKVADELNSHLGAFGTVAAERVLERSDW